MMFTEVQRHKRPLVHKADSFNGHYITIGGEAAFELGNYLGGGVSGVVYEALDLMRNQMVALKILNPVGYKLLPSSHLQRCVVVRRGVRISEDVLSGRSKMQEKHVWWLAHPNTKSVIAAYEDPRFGLSEIPLPRCIEIWGTNPWRYMKSSAETEKGSSSSSSSSSSSGSGSTLTGHKQQPHLRYNHHHHHGHHDGQQYKGDGAFEEWAAEGVQQSVDGMLVTIPRVPAKYVAWLRKRVDIYREIRNMACVGANPNVVGLDQVLELVQSSKLQLFLVLELASGGELFDTLKCGPVVTEEIARQYFGQLLSGILYCHSRGIAHRDLKPSNLLLSDGGEGAVLKIADFGLSAGFLNNDWIDFVEWFDRTASYGDDEKDEEEEEEEGDVDDHDGDDDGDDVRVFESMLGSAQGEEDTFEDGTDLPAHEHHHNHQGDGEEDLSAVRRLRSMVGSPYYMSPEVMRSVGRSQGYDGTKCDVWSMGVILYVMLTLKMPFGRDLTQCKRFKGFKKWVKESDGADSEAQLASLSWFFSSHMSTSVKTLLVGLLHPNAQKRLTVHQAIHHTWMKAL